MFSSAHRCRFVVRRASAFFFFASLLSFFSHLDADDAVTSMSSSLSLPLAVVMSDSPSNNTSPLTLASHSTVEVLSSTAAECLLAPLDPFQHAIIDDLVAEQRLNLIQYTIVFPNSSVNPLTVNLTRLFKGNSYSRVSTLQGQTLLSLAFNYGILSLMTLTIGTAELKVEMVERPTGCMLRLTEEDRIRMVVDLLMRDFKTTPGSNITFRGEERVCYEVVTDNGNGYARFTDHCWFRDRIHGNTVSDTHYANGWLTFLYVMLTSIRFGVLAFGPLLFLSTVSGLIREEFPYTVKLKDPLVKTMVIYRTDLPSSGGIGQPIPAVDELEGRHKLDLRHQRGFPKLWEMIMNNRERIAIGQPFRAKFTQYDILVRYKRLITENKVPVGFWRSIVSSVFFCKLRHVGPFQRCCRADMFRERTCRRAAKGCCGKSAVRRPIQWIQLWRRVGLALLIVLLPTPYYIRLFILYYFEYEEVVARKEAAHQLGLSEHFENSLVHYFLPTSPLFIAIYVVYVMMAFNLAYLARHNEKGRFRKIIIGSFTDLKSLSWINVMKMMVSNVIWPFQRYGLAGCLVVIVYWPIVLPLTSLVYVFYCLPTVYLTVRMFFYSKMAFLRRIKTRSVKKFYQVKHQVDNSVQFFEAAYLLGNGSDEEDVRKTSRYGKSVRHDEETGDSRRSVKTGSVVRANSRFYSIRESVLNSEELDDVTNINREKVPSAKRSVSNASTVMDRIHGSRARRIIEHCLASALCVAALYSTLIVLSECVGCFVEMLVFTLMGIIVNAGTLLKYVALVVMLIVYSYDCFNNVEKKYLKLNRALFSEVKSRVKDLDKVTSLPSFLQENCGFKSQELGEQAEYELSDDVADKPACHWLINDLVLFVDNEDMPRIPRKLFDDVCRIRVAGVPGPVYRGQLLALRQFLRIVVFIFFVFVVILSFGSFVKVSSTNQMIAALAGGSLPFILRMVMEPEKPDIEIGTVSFKSQLDEVIKNFVQYWPIYDLPFELYTDEDEERDRKKAEEKRKKDGGESSESVNVSQSESFDKGLLRKPLTRLDEELLINNNTSDCTDGVRTSIGYPVNDLASETSGAARQTSKVCFGGELNDQPRKTEPDVDIVVYLPLKNDGIWLDQWSDFDEYSNINQLTEVEEDGVDSVDNAEVFELQNTKLKDCRSSSLPCIEQVGRHYVTAPRVGRTLERH